MLSKNLPLNNQGNHSPDNVKFPDLMVRSTPPRHSASLSVTHIMPVLVLLYCQWWGRNTTVHDPKPYNLILNTE